MIGLVRRDTGELVEIVESTVGYDLAALDVVAVPGDPRALAWDPVGRAFVPRPPSDAEITLDALESSPHWQALKRASPQQIDAWLAANMTTVAQARTVLRFVLLALQHLARTRR